jgi:hypothetical protein
MLSKVGTAVATSVGTNVATSLLNPKKDQIAAAPTVTPVIGMPDPLAQEQAKKQSMIEQMARRGRASTIMTNSAQGSGKLGG